MITFEPMLITMPAQVDAALETAVSWVDFLNRGGGWAVAVMLGYAVVRLWSDGKAKDERLFLLLTKQNEVLQDRQAKQLEDHR